MKIDIFYDGGYPCLCSGHLIVTIDGKKYDFGTHVLSSGGYTDWTTGYVEKGDWEFSRYTKFPEGFPMELKDKVLEEINRKIPKGCCGGCI